MDRDIGLADEDGAGIDKAFGGQRRGLRRAAGEDGNTPGGRRSGDLEGLLERHRNAGKGPQGIAAGNRGINPGRGITGTIDVHPDDRIERADVVIPTDSLEGARRSVQTLLNEIRARQSDA